MTHGGYESLVFDQLCSMNYLSLSVKKNEDLLLCMRFAAKTGETFS
jgi:hypothetical protein